MLRILFAALLLPLAAVAQTPTYIGPVGKRTPGAATVQGDPNGTPIPVSGTFTSAGAADTVGATVNLNNNNICASVILAGQGGAGLNLAAGTLDATLTPYISEDNIAWTATRFLSPSGSSSATLTVTNPNPATQLGIVVLGGTRYVQVCTTAFTSGIASAFLVATTASSAAAAGGGGGTVDQGGAAALSGAWPVKVTDGTHTLPTGDSSARTIHVTADNASIAITAASLPLPSGASTAAKQPALGTAGSASADVITVQGIASMTPLAISASSLPLPAGAATQTTLAAISAQLPTALDGSGYLKVHEQGTATVTGSVTVSGTVTANAGSGTMAVSAASLPLPTGASTEASLAKLTLTQGTTTSGKSGTLIQAAASTAAPSYTDGNLYPLSMDLNGGLRISGTVSATNPSVGLTGSAAPTSATFIGGWDGTNLLAPYVATATPGGSDPGLVVRIAGASAGGTSSSFGAAVPATGTAVGYSDGTNMQMPRVFDADSGAGTQYVAGVNLRKTASGGSVEAGTSSDPLRVDPTGTTTQPVSAAALPLPTGAATAAKQPALGTAGSASTDVITVQGIAGMTALKVDGSAVTQPVSGTVTANAGSGTFTVSGTVTANAGSGTFATSNAALALAQGSTTSGQTGPLVQGAVSTAAPSYVNGQTNPFSLTTAGALRVDGSATTQPVSISGTVTIASNSSVNVAQVGGTATDTNSGNKSAGTLRVVIATDQPQLTAALKVDGSAVTQPVSGTVTANAGSGTFAISASSLPLPSGASTAAKQPALGTAGSASTDVITVQGIASMTALKVDGSAVTQPVSGTVTANAGSGTFTVSGTVTANAGSGTFTTTNASLGATGSAVPVSAAYAGWSDGTNLRGARVFDADSGAGTEYVAGVSLRKTASGGSVEVGTSSDPLRVDPTGTTTQPVSAASLPLPSGASTAAKQPALGTAGSASADVITVQGIASMTALKVDGSAVTQPVSGTITANQGTAAAGSGAWPVAVTDTSNTVVKAGDAGNNAIRVNVVAGGAAGGTSSNFGSAVPSAGTAAGFSDGTNMQAARVFDTDSGAGTQYVAGVSLRKTASGGSVEAGTSSDPLRVDPTGTTVQPVSQNGTWIVQPGNTANTTPWLASNNDGTNTQKVLAASTAPAAADKAAVVAISPTAAPVCTSFVAVSQTASATVITGVSAKKIYICSVDLVSDTAQFVNIIEGTGTVCATGGAAVWGSTTAGNGMSFSANGGIAKTAASPFIVTATNADNLCVTQSGSGRLSGNISYVIQ